MRNPKSDDATVKTLKTKHGKGQMQEFDGTNWRKALSHYLDGVWAQKNASVEGVLMIDHVVLFINHGEYNFTCPPSPVYSRPELTRDQIHAITGKRDEFELGLAKFIRNNGIRMLAVEFTDSRMMLWKGPRRTDLFFTVMDRTF